MSVIVAVAIAVGLLTVACHRTMAERAGVRNDSFLDLERAIPYVLEKASRSLAK